MQDATLKSRIFNCLNAILSSIELDTDTIGYGETINIQYCIRSQVS